MIHLLNWQKKILLPGHLDHLHQPNQLEKLYVVHFHRWQSIFFSVVECHIRFGEFGRISLHDMLQAFPFLCFLENVTHPIIYGWVKVCPDFFYFEDSWMCNGQFSSKSSLGACVFPEMGHIWPRKLLVLMVFIK